jgi:pimeloyl-ACP methyl ester carboxylesterase
VTRDAGTTSEPPADTPATDLEPSYVAAGPSDAAPIVFVHGTRLTRTAWSAQLDALSDAYRVIAMDLPGHGSLAHRSFTLTGAADELARVIETAAGGRAVVVGLSLGGYVAMDLASRRPELIRGLVLSGATQEPIGLRARPYLALAWAIDRLGPRGMDRLNRWFFRTRYPPSIADPIISGGFHSAGGSAALRALVGERFAPRLAAYPGPVLIVNGQLDVLFRLGARRFAEHARDVRRVRIAGATHLANLDQPDAFTIAVRRFVDGLDDGPGTGPVLD